MVLFVVALPVALITTNIRVAISEKAVYDYSVRTYDAAQRSGIPQSELLPANSEIRRYLTSGENGPLSIQVQDDNGQTVSLFNAKETAHMADVRDLVSLLFSLQVAAIAVLLTAAVVLLVMFPVRVFAAAALAGSMLTAAVLGLGALAALSGFDSAWSQFHTIVFSNDLWQLNPQTDHLIQMFPEAFWERITMLIGFVSLLEATLIGAVSGVYLMRTQPVYGEERAPMPKPPLPGPAGHSRQLSPPDPHRYVS